MNNNIIKEYYEQENGVDKIVTEKNGAKYKFLIKEYYDENYKCETKNKKICIDSREKNIC